MTQLDRPPSMGAGTSTLSTPIETLAREEIARTRRFCYASFVLSPVTALSTVWLGGDPVAIRLLIGSLAVAMLMAVFLLYRTRHPAQFARASTAFGWFVLGAASCMMIPYFGAFSGVTAAAVLGIFFTSLGKNTRLVYAIYLVWAGAQAVFGLLVITGITRETGLVPAPNLDLRQHLVLQGMIQFTFAITLAVARMSRRTQLAAMEQLEREVRRSAGREALLLEAREQLERVLRPGHGRFSDQQIGSYLLGAVIGRGAMGEVYEATGPGGAVAIKLLSQASLGNANHVLRFIRELQTAAAIEAPNVVKVIEVGEQPVPYLVMERLVGKTLSELLQGKPALTRAAVVEMIHQVGAGITAAGAAGIVHRDLKPQNVFHHGETWKILDFGIARALDQGDTLTAEHIVGTPAYMAPEQASGGAVDHATDLYALAAIAYRALTAYPPFASGEIADTLYRVVHTAPHRPSRLAPQLPPEVDLVLAIGLAKQPADRFATARELGDALEAALTGQFAPAVRQRGLALDRTGAWAEPSPTGLEPGLMIGLQDDGATAQLAGSQRRRT